MEPTEIELVQTTWRQVVPIRELAAKLFYGKLFELDPSLRVLFKGDMVEQGKKLTAMIDVVVLGLNRLEDIVPSVQELGRRHVDYGVTDAHYDTVGKALLWTLETGLGEAFTSDARAAWTSAYGLLATTMQSASRASA